MKATCFLRVAKSTKPGQPFIFDVSAAMPTQPIYGVEGARTTAVIKVTLDLPESAFGPDAEVDIKVPESALTVIAEAESR